MARSAEIYECESCKRCFVHKNMGGRAWSICPAGGMTYSRRVTEKYEKLKPNEGVPAKE